MREIKFRAWDKLQEPPRIEDDCGLERAAYHGTVGNELMQFTGLTDKNDKEIYEGDIVNHMHGDNLKVIFLNGMFKVAAGHVNETIPIYYLLDSIEIIGNIYENTEVLNANNNN